ncbi:Tectonin beta-propeller repeat-containing protein 1 [Labeo rohita]|uniref:Tectonin beta-propeller repeat-containing protein 1 n=1 Tax=Labeo rohita TaxID=84645 RepID=A0ABQ8MUU8_LABRO|nr:Tectonin beta-propeller repeat-containing protein 1 [Labeo rohita]
MMAGSLLWAVDVYGRVFSLSAARGRWRRAADFVLELKRVTGSRQCCWGIGCDHLVYLHVYPSQVPIRHQEETYENQRWNPVDGYTDTLLPTDRWQWTDESGLNPQPLHSFVLPSANWEWEGDWYVDDESCGRESTETGKKWNSCVRRRRWLRYRRYKALGSWAKVPLDRGRPPPEPFIDISCGGWDMSDSPEKHIYLWAVSQQGKLWFRTGIRQQNPEGTRWEPIQVPREVAQVSAGPKDLLWVVLWDGQLLARTGISKDCPKGWISIGGEMVMLSMGPSDQVWGVGSDDRTVYFRHGVTATEVTGSVRVHSDASVFAGEVTAPSQGSVLGCDDTDIPKPRVPKITSDSFISALVSDRSAPTHDPPSSAHSSVPEENQVTSQESDSSILSPSSPSDSSETPWSNVDLEEMKASVPSSARSSVATYPIELQHNTVVQEELPPWAWVTGGGYTDTRTERAQQEKNASTEKSVRVMRGCMCWWRDWPPHQWEDVSVTLEQVTGAGAQTGDILYLYYMHDQEKKYLYAVIKEVTALVPVFRDSLYTVAVYTPERTKQRFPILLATPSQEEFNTWLSLLNASCCASRGLGEHPSKQALWAVTCKGDVMVHDPSPSLEAPAQFWRQVPAHLLCVESNSLGVVWGIAHDHTAWVYMGGSRGPSAQGNENINQAISDVRSVCIYENQRWNPMTGYTDKGLPTDRYMWSDASGLRECTKDNTSPPSPQWTWVSDWAVDYGVPGGTDKEGWQYAADFHVTFHGYKTMKDFVRRRRWARLVYSIAAFELTDSFIHKVPPIALTDVTILPCLAQCSLEQVPVWAISEKGDVLCRLGVTANNPAGNSWLHVGTDQPFKSICIGGGHQVWAIARDGAVFYRGSVSAHNPAGECWYHIPSPPKQMLKQVSVGRTSVYAVDENSNLWYRQGLTPSYPQGSAWELISSNVCKVSVGPLDQVWIIADKVSGYPSESSGTVCHRLGVKPMQPKGLSWDFGIGGGWEHLSVRGNSIEAQRVAPRSPMPSRTQSQCPRATIIITTTTTFFIMLDCTSLFVVVNTLPVSVSCALPTKCDFIYF